MFHIPADVFPADVTVDRFKNRYCQDVTRQGAVIGFWAGAEAEVIDRVSCNFDHLQAQVARAQEVSCWITPVAEMRYRWHALTVLYSMRKSEREWVSAVSHDEVDEYDHWPNGRDAVFRSLFSFGFDGEAHA